MEREGSTAGSGAVTDLERVFADGYTRYQMAMAGTQLGRAVAYRDTLPAGSGWLNVGAASVGVLEAMRRRRAAIVGGSTVALAQVGPTALSTAMVLAATPSRPGARVPRAVLWAHLQAQWAAAGVSVFAPSTLRRLSGLALAALPYAVGPGRRKTVELNIATRVGVGFMSFVSIAEVVARRLRATAEQIDVTRAQLIVEQEALARREEHEELRSGIFEHAADEMSDIRDLVGVNRTEVAVRAATEESLLRGWVNHNPDLFAANAAPKAQHITSEAVEHLELAARRIETVFRLAATGPLAVHAIASGTRSTRLLAIAAVTHAALVSRELNRPDPRRTVVALSDVAMVVTSLAAEARALNRLKDDTAPATTPEALFGYAASLAPCSGTINADPALARKVTAALAGVLAISALSSHGNWSERVLLGSERIVMAAGGSWFTHWLRDVILAQTERLGSATDDLAAARAAAAAAAVRQRAQYLLHDSALQVLLWAQKPDLSDDQLRVWLDREICRLRSSSDGDTDGAYRSVPDAVGDLLDGFTMLGLRPQLDCDPSLALLPDSLVTSVVEVLNEALTNVYKHTDDRSPLVTVRLRGTVLEVVVSNRSPGGDPSVPGTGTRGMRSRVEARSGWFDSRRERDTFVVEARLPVERNPG